MVLFKGYSVLIIHSYRFYFGSVFVLFFGGISLFSSQNYVILNTERVIKLLTASAKFTIQYMEKILKFNKYKYFETATAVLPIFKLLLFLVGFVLHFYTCHLVI